MIDYLVMFFGLQEILSFQVLEKTLNCIQVV